MLPRPADLRFPSYDSRTVLLSRRIVSIAFVVGVVVGCSHDWNIGSGETSQPSGPSGGTDAGQAQPDANTSRDAGNTSTKTSGECGPQCTCKGRERCEFT